MPTVISTKKLTQTQKDFFFSEGIFVKDYDFISIESINFQYSKKFHFSIFTSKNAVKSILQHQDFQEIKKRKVFCVGENTKKKLVKLGFDVVEYANYASELSKIIVENYSQDSFEFFCGNLRSNTLFESFLENNISVCETIVYKTELQPLTITKDFDGILFFSPSAVQSFTQKNKIKNQKIFCIGTTTAASVTFFSKNYEVADKQTVQSVIDKCINYFKNNK